MCREGPIARFQFQSASLPNVTNTERIHFLFETFTDRNNSYFRSSKSLQQAQSHSVIEKKGRGRPFGILDFVDDVDTYWYRRFLTLFSRKWCSLWKNSFSILCLRLYFKMN